MTTRPDFGEVLCSSVSDARFLVIERGTAEGMPSISDVVMFCGTRQPCSTLGDPDVDCELRGGLCYVDVVTGLTLLCIRPGRGPLCFEGRRLAPSGNGRRRLPAAAS